MITIQKTQYRLLLLSLLATLFVSATGQKNRGHSHIKITNCAINTVENDSLQIRFKITVQPNVIGANESVRIIPTIETDDANEKQYLPFAQFNGKRRQGYFVRERNFQDEETFLKNTPHLNVVVSRDKAAEAEYAYTLPPSAQKIKSFRVNHVFFNCCDTIPYPAQLLATQNAALAPMNYSRMVAYITPKPEPKQEQRVQRNVSNSSISYSVNKHDVNPAQTPNKNELRKIDELLAPFANDNSKELKRIVLKSSASPDATWNYNVNLSRKRAESFKHYIISNYGFVPKDIIEIEFIGEDWGKLKGLVVNSDINDIPEKEAVIKIIDTYSNPDAREAAIKKLGKGVAYEFIREHYYPLLRQTQLVFQYETTDIYSEDLSGYQDELNPDSYNEKDWYLKIEALRDEYYHDLTANSAKYTQDPIARFNAAAALIAKEKTLLAKEYLEKPSGSLSGAAKAHNNWGVYYCLNKQFDKAIESFDKAVTLGYSPARKNLEMVRKQLDASNIYKTDDLQLTIGAVE